MHASVPVVLLALLVAPALAAAHGGGEFPHVNPLTVDLGPGGRRQVELTFTEGGPDGTFEAGWVFVLNALVRNGSAPMEVQLRPGHLEALSPAVSTWRLGPGEHHLTGLMPQDGVYTLDFRHAGGEGNATLTFFYDQSCNCAAKPIPVELPRGLVIFNADAKAGATWKATFPEPAVHRLRVTIAERIAETSRWPEDFRPLQTSSAPVVRDAGRGEVRLHELNWTAAADQRYYFLVESVSADLRRFDTSSPDRAVGSVMVTPYFEQLAAAPKPSPGFEAAALLAGLAAAALLAGHRRR